MTSDWRTQTRDLIRSQLALSATDIFAAEGFDGITVDALAHRLGVSRATFFRYFATKEDAVIATLDAPDAGYTEALDAFSRIDVHPGESVWEATLRTLTSVETLHTADSPAMRERVRMVLETPSLRARFQDDRRAREARLADALDRSLRDRLSAEVAAAAALSALDVAWRTWAGDETGGSPFIDVLRATVGALEAAGTRR
ncbi:MAG: TetR family transcriptional regulator [Microbacterium sp.]|uniref:TetR family transcriptional regulator n=1 Tax=Microbacterium sp. TaxID=51671 RepID=UPI003D6E593E